MLQRLLSLFLKRSKTLSIFFVNLRFKKKIFISSDFTIMAEVKSFRFMHVNCCDLSKLE